MKIKPTSIIIALICACVFTCACSMKTSEKKTITVSLQPQKYFLDKIAGDKINIVCLLGNGGNPETYEPSITHLAQLENSIAYFQIGHIAFESAIMEKVRENNPHLKIFNNSNGIDLLRGTHGDCPHHHSHNHGCCDDAVVDPHTWSSVKNAIIIVKNMCDALIELDPENTEYYKSNYNRLSAHLDSLDSRLTAMLSPKQGHAFLVWHPSLSYFARDYNLQQISIGQEGKETSVQQLQSKIDQANTLNTPVFFFQKDFDTRQAEVVNRQINAEMVTINPLNYQWEQEIIHIANAIASK